MTVAGALLLVLAAMVSYSSPALFAARGKVYAQMPGALPGDYIFFSLYWVVLGLPFLVFLFFLLFRQFRAAARAAFRDGKSAAGLVLFLLVLVFSLLPWEPEAENPAYAASKIVFGLILSGCGMALLLSGAYRALSFLDAAMARLYDSLMGLNRWQFLGLAMGLTFVAANLVSWFVNLHTPQVPDSTAQVFQARIFAAGRLFLPSPPFPDFFDYTHIINVAGVTGHPASGFAGANWPGPAGRWYSQYPFLHPLIIAPGVLLGMPWIVNPLLGALAIGAVYFLGREVYDEKTGRIGALLGAVSPFIFNMSAEFMNHASALLFATLFLLFFFRTVRAGEAAIPDSGASSLKLEAAGGWWSAGLAGLFIGFVADIRPYTALAVVLPFAVYGSVLAVRKPGFYLARFALLAAAAIVVTSLVLVYNSLTNGDPGLFGYVVKYGTGHEIGFGRSAWGDSHTPLKGLISTGHDLNMLNRFLFEWPIPALLPIGVLFAAGVASRRDWLLLLGFLALPVAYFFYWFHQACFGPRFLYEAGACILLLTARGGMALGPLARRLFGLDVTDKAAARLVSRAVPLFLLWALAIGLPPLLRAYRAPAKVNAQPVLNARKAGLKNALVFCNDFGGGFTANRLTLDGDVVFAKDYGMINSVLTIAFPDREYWYANRDTLVRLESLAYGESRLRRTIESMSVPLADSTLARYKTLLWPLRDIPPPGRDPGLVSERLVDYRELSRELFTGRHEFDDYLPALACWLLKDEREHLRLFGFMDDLQSYIADDYKFTLLYVNDDGTAAYYDIRRTSGEEIRERDGGKPSR
jgi:hypothetical protein